MTVICRTCLNEINDESVTFYLDSTDSKSSTITVRCKLEHCVPEMDLDVVPNAAICSSCLEGLTLAHEFKNKCLETEGRIQSYIEQMGYVLTCIDLRDIVEQNKLKPKMFQTADMKPVFCISDCTSFMQQPNYTMSKNSSQEITLPTIYDTNRNPIIGSLLNVKQEEVQLKEESKEKSLDIKNLQCDTQNFFAVPKIAQLLASNENSYKCGQCNYTTSSDFELKNHEKGHTSQELHKCSECDYSAPKRQMLIIHMRKHTGEKLYNCNDCDYGTPYKNTLVQHLMIHEGERPHKCPMCDFSSIYDKELNKHIKIHAVSKPYKCNLCNYRGRLKFDLKIHKRTHAGEKPYKCLLCDYCSSHKTNLVYHMKMHTREKPYKCKICSYKSSHKTNLRNHMRTHNGQKPSKYKHHEYSVTQSLKKINTGEKPYLCTYCDYTTLTEINLVKHILIHTGEKPFLCSNCDYKTATKTDLEEHMIVHASSICSTPFVCIVCQETFNNMEKLRNHTQYHKNSSETENADTDTSINVDITEPISDTTNVFDRTNCQITPDISNYESAVKTK